MTNRTHLRFARLATLLGFVFTSAIFQGSAPAQQADAPTQSFTIRVIGADSRPIPGVRLWLTADYYQFPVYVPGAPQGHDNSTTGENGEASVHMPAGPVNVVATADGYAPVLVRGMDLAKLPVTEIRLSAGQSITGKLLTPDRKPIAGATVTARRKDFPLNYMEEFTPSTMSDAEGHFAVAHLIDDTYVLTVQSPPALAGLSFDPLAIAVAANAAPAPVELLPKAGVVIKGKFIAPPGEDAGGKKITALIRLPQQMRWEITTDFDGGFVVDNIPAGARGFIAFPASRSYSTVISVPPGQSVVRANNQSLELMSPPAAIYQGIEVRMLLPVQVKGKVTDAAGKPLANVMIVAEPTNRVYTSTPGGDFVAELPPGVPGGLRILQDNGYLSSALTPVKGDAGQLVEQNLIAQLKPVLPHDGEISGKVVDADGKPASGAKVYLGNDAVLSDDLTGPRRNGSPRPTWAAGTVFPGQLTADEQGHFRFDMLDAGKTDIWATLGNGWAFKADVSYNDKDLTLALSPGGEQITIDGTLTDSNGHGVGGAKLYLFTGGAGVAPQLLTQVNSEPDGRYSISLIPPDERSTVKFVRLIGVGEPGITWRNLPQCSLHDVQLQYHPSARLTGRVVDRDGRPVRGARVRAAQLDHPVLGKLNLYRDMAQVSQWFDTDENGMYQFTGVPVGTTILLQARHSDFGANETLFVHDLTTQSSAEDAKLTPPIIIEGNVRHLETHQPVQGATVSLGRDRDWLLVQATTDAEGHYRMSGLSRDTFIDQLAAFKVTLGNPPQLEGRLGYNTRLSAGDQVNVDIPVQRPQAVREAEWRAKPGKPLDSNALVAVLEDADPAISDKAEYHDTLTIYDAQGLVRGRYDQLHVVSNGGWGNMIGWSPVDGSIWLNENMGRRFLNFSAQGKLIFEQKDAGITSFAFDGKNGNIWSLGGGTILGSSTIRVFDPRLGPLATYPVMGSTIAYSAREECFWVVGSQLHKVDRSGKVLATGATRFVESAMSLAVNDGDGSVWVTESAHPQRQGTFDRLIIFEPDGRIRRQIDGPDNAVVVDGAHGVGWALARRSQWPMLGSFDSNGNARVSVPLLGSGIAVEPDTGYLWVGGETTIDRLDRDGRVVKTISAGSKSQKWIAVTKGP